VAYFAAALARGDSGWTGQELELDDVDDLDGLIEELRRVSDDASTLLLFVEEDDEWFGVIRLDGDGDPHAFLSDGRAVETSERGALLGEAATVTDVADPDDDEDDDDDDDDDDDTGARIAGDPIGEPELMADLGTPAKRLLDLCAEEGQLPADIISALCESAGCLDVLETVRGT
jgi:putative tRNA adenosine deaminase-associated protein